MTSLAWKRFYADERAALGEAGLRRLLDEAPAMSLPAGGALGFPHTLLRVTGGMVAAVARAVVEAGADRVLAIGVLHGGREADHDAIAQARAGAPDALRAFRRVHGPDLPGDEGRWAEEFSLDGFAALLALAAAAVGRRPPTLVDRYPFLVGDPTTLPGRDALLVDADAVVVTTDPMHHGIGYGTPPTELLPTRVAAPALAAQLADLGHGRWTAFATRCAAVRSDFRDAGPALATRVGPFDATIHELVCVDYAGVLEGGAPTWVAAGRFTVSPRAVTPRV
jgi:hypothetical protein